MLFCGVNAVAMYGIVHVPVNNEPSWGVATGPPPVVVNTGPIFMTVEVGAFQECVPLLKPVDEHPMKFDMLILYVLHIWIS